MRKKCMIYGNCQHTHLEHFLERTDFAKYYDFIKIKDVYVRDKKFLDDETLASLDCFIYQHISKEFDPFFATDTLCNKLKPSCERILIPNFWLSAYFPQHCAHSVVRPNKKYSISSSGIFPYGDSNINGLLSADMSSDNIVKWLSDPDFYNKNTVLANAEKSFASLEDREKKFAVTIPSVDWLRKQYDKKYISVTVNHPTHDYFLWLTENILNLLNISTFSCADINIFPFACGHIQTPIYPSVIKHLGLKFINPDYHYVFYNEKCTFNQYIYKYIAHATGDNVPGKDVITIDRVGKVLSEEIKLLPCPQSTQRIKVLKETFVGYEHVCLETNRVVWKGVVSEVPEKNVFKDIPGLEINFFGKGNLVWIHDKADFSSSRIILENNAYVHIGCSRFGNLHISNRFHLGGVCFIGDNCVAGEELKINLYGNNVCLIGKDCIFGDKTKIMCSDGQTLFDKDRTILNNNESVTIGNHVWIGYQTTLLKGSYIPDNCVVGAGSLVTGAFSETEAVFAGVPARYVKRNVQWNSRNPEAFV